MLSKTKKDYRYPSYQKSASYQKKCNILGMGMGIILELVTTETVTTSDYDNLQL
jgi:hypothetical protein